MQQFKDFAEYVNSNLYKVSTKNQKRLNKLRQRKDSLLELIEETSNRSDYQVRSLDKHVISNVNTELIKIQQVLQNELNFLLTNIKTTTYLTGELLFNIEPDTKPTNFSLCSIINKNTTIDPLKLINFKHTLTDEFLKALPAIEEDSTSPLNINSFLKESCNNRYVAKIINIEKHPSADHVDIVTVSFGDTKIKTIIAKNVFYPLQTVIVDTRRKRKIKGLVSYGRIHTIKQFQNDNPYIWKATCDKMQNALKIREQYLLNIIEQKKAEQDYLLIAVNKHLIIKYKTDLNKTQQLLNSSKTIKESDIEEIQQDIEMLMFTEKVIDPTQTVFSLKGVKSMRKYSYYDNLTYQLVQPVKKTISLKDIETNLIMNTFHLVTNDFTIILDFETTDSITIKLKNNTTKTSLDALRFFLKQYTIISS